MPSHKNVRNVEYIERTVDGAFQHEFMEAMYVPYSSDEFPHFDGFVPDEVLSL